MNKDKDLRKNNDNTMILFPAILEQMERHLTAPILEQEKTGYAVKLIQKQLNEV